jgi:uncharacterized membrane protein
MEERLPDSSLKGIAMLTLMGLFIGTFAFIMILIDVLGIGRIDPAGYLIVAVMCLWGIVSWIILIQALINERRNKEAKK